MRSPLIAASIALALFAGAQITRRSMLWPKRLTHSLLASASR